MNISNSHYSLSLCDDNGSIISFGNFNKEFIQSGGDTRPLFKIRFLNDSGVPFDIGADESTHFNMIREITGECTEIKMYYSFEGKLPVSVLVKIRCPHDSPFTYWNLSVEHHTGWYIEWIDFPDIIVPDDLIANNGRSRIFWPSMEGCLVEDAALRDKTWLKYSPVGYPSKGWEGYYPAACPMQFMAYYDENGGLYIGAHDGECNIKAIEYYKAGNGVKLENRLFPGAIRNGKYEMEYDIVLGVFSGDWHDAAEIYRNWFEGSEIKKPAKLYENSDLPEWIKDSPVVVTYPVRGVKDTGDMKPNGYFPYVNALPHLNRLSEEIGSNILALLMHWEGTAPWAPPYVWPPFGGEELFREFIDALHGKGNLAGVYCSGIGWTNESVLVPEYNRKAQFEEENLADIMCAAPDGSVPHSLICNGTIRWGHDMCPANKFVEDTVFDEVSKIIQTGCDYIQFFDQNLGGASYFCYSKKHGHPPAPGKWQKEAMEGILKRLMDIVDRSGKKTVIGCESAAAEPYIPYLMFNDLRFNINYFYAKPVPAYAYIFHEYINNFMGNQNNSCAAISIEKTPDNLLFRLAYSFIAGDMLTLVLKDKGEINWDWGTEWTVPGLDQDAVKKLVGNLNVWRKNAAKPFLCFGRMLKPYEINGAHSVELTLYHGSKLVYPSLLSSRWISPEGREAQIFVNYTKKPQKFTLDYPVSDYNSIKIWRSAKGETCEKFDNLDKLSGLEIAPLSALMIEMQP